jgi:very-short-patch-repair endonuclease
MGGPIRKAPAQDALAWLATKQGGHVTRRQLTAVGVSRRRIERGLERGLLIPVHRGVYLLAHRAPSEWAREFAAVLACGPGALISHRSAGRVHGLTSYPATGQVWVTTTTERGANLRGVRTRQTRVLEPHDVAFEGWLPVTSPARTLLDLAGCEDADVLEEAVASAQVRRLVREEHLWEQLSRGNGRRGARELRRLMERNAPPAPTRSRAERMMLRLIRRSGLPEPLVNANIGRWYPDFYWPQEKVVAEYDSSTFHMDIASFRRDREKSNDLQLRGIVVLRFTWHELTRRPRALEARLRQALGLQPSGFRG